MIEWEANKRICGDKRYIFLSNCKATLGTESGSNIFDLREILKQILKKRYQKIHYSHTKKPSTDILSSMKES